MNIIILLTSRPTDNLRVLVLLRALMFDVHHSLRYVTLCCVFCSSFTHCNFKEFLCRFNGRSFEVFLKRRKILELWKSVLFVSSRGEQVFLVTLCIFMWFASLELLESIFSEVLHCELIWKVMFLFINLKTPRYDIYDQMLWVGW